MKGKNTHRFKDNPLEKRFAEKWAEQNKFSHTLEYILSDRVNEREPISEEIQEAVATVIQWLGSPVGQAFLEEALGFDVRKHISRKLLGL